MIEVEICKQHAVCEICVLYSGNPEETAARATASEKDGDIKRISTKEWARSTGYDPVKLFNKVKVNLSCGAVFDADCVTYFMCSVLIFAQVCGI